MQVLNAAFLIDYRSKDRQGTTIRRAHAYVNQRMAVAERYFAKMRALVRQYGYGESFGRTGAESGELMRA